VPFVLIAVAEQHISSSLAAILVATMPLLVALLSVRFSPGDRPAGLRLIGWFSASAVSLLCSASMSPAGPASSSVRPSF
jgi:drug/metabolite transporter (DMT)-like permease